MGAKTIEDITVDTRILLKDQKKLSINGSAITLTNNEIKDIMKVIRSRKNRGILLKGTTRKLTSQEGGFLNFLKPFDRWFTINKKCTHSIS